MKITAYIALNFGETKRKIDRKSDMISLIFTVLRFISDQV